MGEYRQRDNAGALNTWGSLLGGQRGGRMGFARTFASGTVTTVVPGEWFQGHMGILKSLSE